MSFLSNLSRALPFLAGLGVPGVMVSSWLSGAEARLHEQEPRTSQAAVATVAEEGYCTSELKRIVRRVAGACGLLGAEGRGCRPADASQVVSLSGEDFNALFLPLRERVRIIQYTSNSSELDDAGKKAVEEAWALRGGASFFFVVSRASPDGSTTRNRELSEQRAQAVMGHLQTRFADPDIERQVGLLWLGEEFAQLDETFCDWQRSRTGEPCTAKDINRSAFIAWIDCAI